MADLLIRFDDASLTSFSWCHADSDTEPGSWSHLEQSALRELCQKYRSIVILLPQQSVFLSQVELPEKSARQVLSSIEFLIEDQLASDIEELHFAVGGVTADQASIAIVSKDLMDRCQDLQKENRFTATKILPEIFLCPWPESVIDSEVHIYCSGDSCLLRYGLYQGVKCPSMLLEQYLNIIDSETSIKKTIYYCAHEGECGCLKVGQFNPEQSLWAENFSYDFNHAIELKQRQYQSASPWLKLIRIWRPLFFVLLVLVVIFVLNRFVDLEKLSLNLDEIKQQQHEVLSPYFSEQELAGGSLKGLLVKALQKNQSASTSKGLLDMLQEFTRFKQRFKAVQINQFSYRNNQLSIDVSSAQLSSIEQLKSALESGVYTVKLENLTIKPELSSGRLVLGGE